MLKREGTNETYYICINIKADYILRGIYFLEYVICKVRTKLVVCVHFYFPSRAMSIVKQYVCTTL